MDPISNSLSTEKLYYVLLARLYLSFFLCCIHKNSSVHFTFKNEKLQIETNTSQRVKNLQSNNIKLQLKKSYMFVYHFTILYTLLKNI